MDDDLEEEFDAFYRAEFGRLAGALRLACGGDGRAGEELAQEAMVRAWQRWRRLRDLDRPAGWLYVTGFNLVKRRARLRRLPDAGRWASPPGRDDLAATDDRVALEAAVAALPLQQRKAVVARHVLGLTTEEAAEMLGTSAGALRAVLHRAVVALRQSPGLSGPHP